MKLGSFDFSLADTYYSTTYGDDFVLCYRWTWVEELLLSGFTFPDPWGKKVPEYENDHFVVPLSIYNAAKIFTEKNGYAGMTLAEFVNKFRTDTNTPGTVDANK